MGIFAGIALKLEKLSMSMSILANCCDRQKETAVNTVNIVLHVNNKLGTIFLEFNYF